MAIKKQNINLENIPDNAKVCPKPIQTPGLNTSNGDRAIQEANYGPAEGKSACGNCALFDASSRIKGCTGESSKVGYCWANHFECESQNVCDVYEEGGPITDDGESYVLQMVNEDAALSDSPYEGGDVARPEQQVVEEPVQQQPVEVMQPEINQQAPPQEMMPPQGMMPPMEQPMMAYGGDLPKAQMGDWFSGKVNQVKNFATDKYNQAQDFKTQLTDTYKESDFYKKGQDFLDKGQDALSVAGMIPGIGAIPDVVNTAISGARMSGSQALDDTEALKDNAENLAWNAAAIIPGAGQAATTAKFTKRAIQNAPGTIKNFAKGHNALDTTTNIFSGAENLVDSPVETDVVQPEEPAIEEPTVTRDGYELPRALYGTPSPTKGSPYTGNPLVNLLTFPHWSATMNLGSGFGSGGDEGEGEGEEEQAYQPVDEINGKKVYYNKETGEYESELDYRDRVGQEYYEKLNQENPDHFGQVEAFDSNSETVVYTSEEEKNKIGSTAIRNNPEADAIAYNVDDDGNFKFNAANWNPETQQYDQIVPNTWTPQYANTVEQLRKFIPNYNPNDYRNVSQSPNFAYPNQDEQFQTYWNNYYMNNPYRAYEQMAEGGELPLAKNGYHMSYHNRGKTHGQRNKYGYYPYSIPAGGDWETVQHGTNQPKWEETEGWKEDSAGNQTWSINQNDAQKWLRGRGHLTKDLTDQQKQTWAFNMYHGSPVSFKKWTHPNTKKDMVIVEMGRDKIYVPADSALGQFNADQFNEYKKQSEGSYSHLSTPFYDHKSQEDADGNRIKRTDEQKQLEYDWRNTPYQQEYRIGKDGYTWGGWKYNGDDRDMTYKFRDTDLSTLPYKLQQKYRIDNRSRLTKDAKTGKIYVYNEGKHSPTIQYDDLKWFNNPGRLGDVQTDPSFGKGDNIFEYLNNPDFKYGKKYPDLDEEKIKKKDWNKFMWDAEQEVKRNEEEQGINVDKPTKLKYIPEEEEEEETISIFKPGKKGDKKEVDLNKKTFEGPVIPSIQDVNVTDVKNNNINVNVTDQQEKERKGVNELWTPIAESMGASTGAKQVSSKITNSAANAIAKAYQTGTLQGETYSEKDLQRDLNLYGEAYGSENLEKLRKHLELPTSKYGSELSRFVYGGAGGKHSEFKDQTEFAQNEVRHHHIESIAERGKELPKAQINIRNEADYSRFWKPDWKDEMHFSTGPTDYNTTIGLNLDSNSVLNTNVNEFEMDTGNAMANFQQDQYAQKNPDLAGVPTMGDLQTEVDEGQAVQEELDASGTPTPNPQAQFTEFMDQSEGMKNKNDFSQLTDEERDALNQHQQSGTSGGGGGEEEEEEGPGVKNVFAAVASDIVGLAQGVFNPMLEAKEARKARQKEMTKSSDEIFAATDATQGDDPWQTGMDTIYQDVDYGTQVRYGKELREASTGLESEITNIDDWRNLHNRYDTDDSHKYTDQEWQELMYPHDDIYWNENFSNDDRFMTNRVFGKDTWVRANAPEATPITNYYSTYQSPTGDWDTDIEYYKYNPLDGNPNWNQGQYDHHANWGSSENYSNWAGNRKRYKPGNDYKGYYSDQIYGFEEPLKFNEQQLQDIFDTSYSPRYIDRKGRFSRKENDYVNRHRDDYLKLKNIFEESAGQELDPMQVHDIYRAMNYGAQREGSWIDPSVPTRQRYFMDDYAFGEYDDYMNKMHPDEKLATNEKPIINEQTSGFPNFQFRTPLNTNDEFVYDDSNELNIEAYPEETEEISIFKPKQNVSAKRKEYIPISQRHLQEEVVDNTQSIEESEDDKWARKKAKRAAMFADTGGEVEISEELYRKLIAAGADIEIL